MVLITLVHMCPGVLTMEAKDKEVRAFSSMDRATQWLEENNFYYGRRYFFNYKGDAKEWCHKNDVSWEFIDVIINEYEIDDTEVSGYRWFFPKEAPWAEAMRENESSE